jgi:hypothetical protein
MRVRILQVEKKTTKKRKPPSNPTGKKSSQATLLLRHDTVYSMLCDGKSRTDVIRTAAEMWDVSERTADEYLKHARLKLEQDSSISREALMAEAFAAYRQIRQQCERRGQLMAALKAVENMTSLAGLGK